VLFCFGYGYVARSMAKVGTSRTQHGENLFLYNGGPFSRDIIDALQQSDALLISIPPDPKGDPLISFIGEISPKLTRLKWIGYLSSTSVYGNHRGNWVDETSTTCPTSPQGIARLIAEHQWHQLWEDTGLPVHIFRLAGIYGPGRNVLEDIKAGKAQRIFKEGVLFSRIHVEDIAQALNASIKAPHPGQIYNVADNEPAPSHEVVAYGAELLGMDPPPLIPYEEAYLTPMGQNFYQDSKRVSNNRLLNELVPALLFPTYREGLQEIASKMS
jgi:nucleoside-diphosphate-sugar epimerase